MSGVTAFKLTKGTPRYTRSCNPSPAPCSKITTEKMGKSLAWLAALSVAGPRGVVKFKLLTTEAGCYGSCHKGCNGTKHMSGHWHKSSSIDNNTPRSVERLTSDTSEPPSLPLSLPLSFPSCFPEVPISCEPAGKQSWPVVGQSLTPSAPRCVIYHASHLDLIWALRLGFSLFHPAQSVAQPRSGVPHQGYRRWWFKKRLPRPLDVNHHYLEGVWGGGRTLCCLP